MRNKFSELVNAGVASFHHEPIAPELPNNPTGDYMSRLYNMYWGAATDSHMDISQEGRLLIKGRITQDPCKWETLMFSPTWGGISWCQSGYCTLGEFLHANNVQPVVAMHNGEQGIELITKEEIPAQFTAPAAVTFKKPSRVLTTPSSLLKTSIIQDGLLEINGLLVRAKWLAPMIHPME